MSVYGACRRRGRIVLGNGRLAASPNEQPVAIASLAHARQGQSVVAVQGGEQLTERQLPEALIIPSGNNIAPVLAAQVAGSETRFVAEMNAEARALGMDHPIYSDPRGFDPGTVSTAGGQLRVFQQAIGRTPRRGSAWQLVDSVGSASQVRDGYVWSRGWPRSRRARL